MTLKKINTSRFNLDFAGDTKGGIFGVSVEPAEANVILIPVPWEATVSYAKGTQHGPATIRKASSQLDLFDPGWADLGMANPWEYGICLLKENPLLKRWNSQGKILSKPIVDAGGDIKNNKKLRANLDKVNALSGKLNDWVFAQAKEWLSKGKVVGLVGGEHSISYGGIRAIAEKYEDIGILHIDAHADLRTAYEGFAHSHASIMHNVLDSFPNISKLVQVGIRDISQNEFEKIQASSRIVTWFSHALFQEIARGETWHVLCDKIIRDLPEYVYLSFDIDGLDPSLCPHTGTAVPGGLSFNDADYLLKALTKSGRKVVGFDLVEVAPDSKNKSDEWDGNVGARILYKLCACSLRSLIG